MTSFASLMPLDSSGALTTDDGEVCRNLRFGVSSTGKFSIIVGEAGRNIGLEFCSIDMLIPFIGDEQSESTEMASSAWGGGGRAGGRGDDGVEVLSLCGIGRVTLVR